MRSLIRRWSLLFSFLAAAGRVAAVPALLPTTQGDESLLPPVAADAPAALHAGPWVQEVSAQTTTLMFETTAPLAVTVTLRLAVGGNILAEVTDRPVRIHAVKATGLTPGTTYHYTLTAPDADKPLAAGELTTWPEDLSTVRFFAYGDTRTRPDEHRRIAEAMAAGAADHLFVLHSGDLVADGRVYSQWQDQFFGPAQALFARLPVYAVPGNHERGSELFRAYLAQPAPEWYFSLRVGPVHLTCIDNYRDLAEGEAWRTTDQGRWLVADLEKAQSAPWRIAMFHTPLYSLGPHGKLDDAGRPKESAMRFAREKLEPLLRANGYQLTINGHDHVYERSEKDGLTMITAGGGGAPNYAQGPPAQNPYSKIFLSTTHYCDFTADEHTLECRVYDGAGQQIDRFILRR